MALSESHLHSSICIICSWLVAIKSSTELMLIVNIYMYVKKKKVQVGKDQEKA